MSRLSFLIKPYNPPKTKRVKVTLFEVRVRGMSQGRVELQVREGLDNDWQPAMWLCVGDSVQVVTDAERTYENG